MQKALIFFFIVLIMIAGCTPREEIPQETIGEFAPEDAYLDGAKHAYYGSENEWNKRFFYKHIKEYYKRRGQRQMLDIVEGRADEAAAYCRELLADNPEDVEMVINQKIYQTDAYVQYDLAVVKELGLMRGVRLARLEISPVQYNPVLNKIKVCNNLQIEIEFIGGWAGKIWS